MHVDWATDDLPLLGQWQRLMAELSNKDVASFKHFVRILPAMFRELLATIDTNACCVIGLGFFVLYLCLYLYQTFITKAVVRLYPLHNSCSSLNIRPFLFGWRNWYFILIFLWRWVCDILFCLVLYCLPLCLIASNRTKMSILIARQYYLPEFRIKVKSTNLHNIKVQM